MVHQSTKTKVFEKLSASLRTAPRGSREFDIIVSFLLGDTSSESAQMIQLLVEEGYSWDIISELLDQDLPPYTTALDAALPGENIVLALHSAKRGKWAAVQRTPGGNDVLVWATTEPLARRAAALKALRPDLRAARSKAMRTEATRPEVAHPAAVPPEAGPAPAAPPRPAPAPAPAPAPEWREPQAASPEAEHEEEAEEEWKILF
jgi:hypothetical protein